MDMRGRMFPAQFTSQIVCSIVSAGNRAFWWSVFGFGTVGRGGVHIRQNVQDMVESLLTNGEEGKERVRGGGREAKERGK